MGFWSNGVVEWWSQIEGRVLKGGKATSTPSPMDLFMEDSGMNKQGS